MFGCYLGLALLPGFAGVVGIRFVAGAAEATFVVALYTATMDISPEERRGEAVSLVTLASYLGLTFGPHGICVGPDSAVYIGDTLNHRVRLVK